MKIHTIGLLLVLSSLLAGCATPPQTPIKLAKADINSGAGRVGVIMTNLPQLDTQVPGANCLLCLAFAVQSNSALTAHAQTLGYDDLPQFKQEVAAALRKHGATVVVIEEPLFLDKLSDFSGSGESIARKDFRAFKQKHQVDKLLVLDIRQLGFRRNYSSYVPTSDPKGLFLGMGYLVNLADNRYEWYESVEINKGADQNWDEPPKFPGLTNAYYQALEMGKDQLIKPLQTLGGDAVSTRAAAARTTSLPSSNPAAAPKQTDNTPQPAVSGASSSQVPPQSAQPARRLRAMPVNTGRQPQAGDEWEYTTSDRLFGKSKKMIWRVKETNAGGTHEELLVDGLIVTQRIFRGQPSLIATPSEMGFLLSQHWDSRNGTLPSLAVEGDGECVKRLKCSIANVKFVGRERITVAAGTFDTVRIDATLSIDPAAIPDYGKVSFWYSERDRRLVRQMASLRSSRLGFTMDELIELQAARTYQ